MLESRAVFRVNFVDWWKTASTLGYRKLLSVMISLASFLPTYTLLHLSYPLPTPTPHTPPRPHPLPPPPPFSTHTHPSQTASNIDPLVFQSEPLAVWYSYIRIDKVLPRNGLFPKNGLFGLSRYCQDPNT